MSRTQAGRWVEEEHGIQHPKNHYVDAHINEAYNTIIISRLTRTKYEQTKRINIAFETLRLYAKEFSVSRPSIFGSVARDQANAKSDKDILVEFSGAATFDNYMDLKFYLQDLLNMNADLVTQKALRPQIREEIEKELINVPQ